MCKFCSGAIKIVAQTYMDTIFVSDYFFAPHTRPEQVRKMPVVAVYRQKREVCYKPFYKKSFSFCPYCGRKLGESNETQNR